METPELRSRFLAVHGRLVDYLTSQGIDLLGTQPTPSNIAGGLSTIEEKALGNIQKTGTSPIAGVLAPAEAPERAGLHFMDTSCAMGECLTLFGAARSALHLFTTGQASIVGHPVMPVIKISANPKATAGMSDHIDVDISDVLTRKITIAEAADRIVAMMRRTANGRLTAAEVLGHREFVPPRLHLSA
jgi:(2R)-sulfolactate sulfo-lyase subunit beta